MGAVKAKKWMCPDGGTCHHECSNSCFRVLACGPLSGVFPRDTWPEEIRTAHQESSRMLDLLTVEELKAIELTAALANQMGQVVSHGPQRVHDMSEIVAQIHAIQHTIMAQAASRAYPEKFRPLGGREEPEPEEASKEEVAERTVPAVLFEEACALLERFLVAPPGSLTANGLQAKAGNLLAGFVQEGHLKR